MYVASPVVGGSIAPNEWATEWWARFEKRRTKKELLLSLFTMRDAPEECEHVRELAMQIAKHFDWSQNVEHDIVLLWE